MKKISLFILIFFLLFCVSLKSNANEETYAHYHIIDIDHPLSFEEIKKRYEAYDSVDGNISSDILFQSNYESDYANQQIKVFDYPLHISITNSRGKQCIWNDMISVRDFTAPIISSKESELFVDISQENLQEKMIQNLTINDNYDKEFNYSWMGLEEIKQGSGTYMIGISVIDQSNNLSNVEYMKVHIQESVQRILSKKAIYIENTSLDEKGLINEFLKNNSIQFSYKDITVTSHYLDTPQKNGTYQAEFKLTNEDGLCWIYQCKIVNQVHNKTKKDKTMIYLSSGIIGILLLVGIIIYRKRR